ncbi:hypothetical protein HDE_06750 [Halotydeus destructor]|nr:hypothetical protein HDE_06750 [Halotydeus destructor]
MDKNSLLQRLPEDKSKTSSEKRLRKRHDEQLLLKELSRENAVRAERQYGDHVDRRLGVSVASCLLTQGIAIFGNHVGQ